MPVGIASLTNMKGSMNDVIAIEDDDNDDESSFCKYLEANLYVPPLEQNSNSILDQDKYVTRSLTPEKVSRCEYENQSNNQTSAKLCACGGVQPQSCICNFSHDNQTDSTSDRNNPFAKFAFGGKS
jgi:hypothetical protein